MDTFAPLILPLYPKGHLFSVMEIELHPGVSLLENTLNILIAPAGMLIEALNSHLNLQRYKILYLPGNCSRILSRLSRNFTDLDIRRPLPVSSS